MTESHREAPGAAKPVVGKREEMAQVLHERESMMPWEHASPLQCGRAYGHVDAVLACLSEPNEAMLAAFHKVGDLDSGNQMWQAMLKAVK